MRDSSKQPLLDDLQFRGYIPDLDLLRGIAILSVLLHHGVESRLPWDTVGGAQRYLIYLTSWGRTGVHLFFILSGFLITGILLDTKDRADYWTRFYRNRALRILPAYILMLVVLKASDTVSWRFVIAAMLYIANMAKLMGAQMNEYGSLWSLAVEEQFYLIWPLAVRRLSLKTLTRLMIFVIVLSPILFLTAELSGVTFDIRYKLWGNACWLLCGALIAVSLRTGVLNRANIARIAWSLLATSAVGLPIMAYAQMHLSPGSWTTYATGENVLFIAIMPLYCALLLFVVDANQGPKAEVVRGPVRQFLAFLGYISYGLYLVNWFIFTRCDSFLQKTRFEPRLHDLAWVLVTAVAYSAISIGIAFLSRRYVEEWFLRLKAHR
jgi:peptidoglycan/LPS O-acetylase OafA/YrhL